MSKSPHVHLIGIGGTGMTALAGLLAADGCRVTGSDKALYPPTSTILGRLGLELHERFDGENLDPAPDLVVVGNAVSRGNPEVEAMLERDLEYTSMARLIHDRFLRNRHSIVVAGTHGKTTITSMLAWVLEQAGRDPGFLIGGWPGNFELPFKLGKGPAFVIEGDEYDTAFFDKGPKFMHYRPDTALIGTIEFDHADIYRDVHDVETAFRRLVNIVPGNGLIIRHEDCGATRDVTSAAWSKVEGYGLATGEWQAADFVDSKDGVRFVIERGGRHFADCRMRQSGRHTVLNALSVAAAANAQGLTASDIASGLASFTGVRRRLELRGEADGVRVLDDFAHHPTAISITLEAVKHRYPDARIWAVLEPRSWSLRRNVFQERLVEAFDSVDRVLLAPVFRAEEVEPHERLDVDRLAGALQHRGLDASAARSIAEILQSLGSETSPGDVVVVMSNGGFDGLHERLLEALHQRAASASPAGG